MVCANAQTEITAKQFYSEFKKNEIGADFKYEGKILIITGEILSIDKTDVLGTVTLSITLVGETQCFDFLCINKLDLPGVYCKFPNSERGKIAQLSIGQFVSIKGQYNGTTLNIPELKNCSIYRTPQQI